MLIRTLIVIVLVLAAVVATTAAISVTPYKGTATQKSKMIAGPDARIAVADAR